MKISTTSTPSYWDYRLPLRDEFLLMTACMQTKSFHRTNGWYYVTSQTTDSLSQTPFLTVMDFDSLRLETDAFGHSVITGVFLQDKLPIWREATTKSVGKYIAFVFNDTVITAPQVNSPIESGCFQISNPHGYDLERIFRELQKEIDISRFGN